MIRYYFVPKIGDGNGIPFSPKYFVVDSDVFTKTIIGDFQCMDYGLEDMFLVAADVTNLEHNAITANSDVIAVPSNLNNTVGANLAVVQNKLELLNMPSHWVTSTMTYRNVLKTTIRIIQFMQRFHGMAGKMFQTGVNLDTQIKDIPVTPRQKLQEAAQSFGIDTSNITNTMTVRQALKEVADQIYPNPITFGDKQL